MDTYNILALKLQLLSLKLLFNDLSEEQDTSEENLFLLLRSMLNIQQFSRVDSTTTKMRIYT